MNYPKWMYRTHPALGVFQQTRVASAEAETELEAGWSDTSAEGATHGETDPLFEPAPVVTTASIEAVTTADLNG